MHANSIDAPPKNGEHKVVSSSGINDKIDLMARFFPPGYLKGYFGYFFGNSTKESRSLNR